MRWCWSLWSVWWSASAGAKALPTFCRLVEQGAAAQAQAVEAGEVKPRNILCRLSRLRASGYDCCQAVEKSGLAAPLMWALSALDCAIEQPRQQGQPSLAASRVSTTLESQIKHCLFIVMLPIELRRPVLAWLLGG